jgi:glycine betaine catabolism B
MIENATDKQLPVKIVMFGSNRNEQNILYKYEFNGWANTNKPIKTARNNHLLLVLGQANEGE